MSTLLHESLVTTRKRHRCFACLRPFEKGTKMLSQTCVGDGMYTVYTCSTCRTLIDKMHDSIFDDCEMGYPEGCIRESLSSYNVTTPEELLELFSSTEKT